MRLGFHRGLLAGPESPTLVEYFMCKSVLKDRSLRFHPRTRKLLESVLGFRD